MKKFVRLLSAVICLLLMMNFVAACGIFQGSESASGSSTDGTTGENEDESKNNTSEKNTGDEKSTDDGKSEESETFDQIDQEEPVYTLVYKGGEGSTGNAPTAARAKAGEKIILSANTFVKSGYIFSGWSDGTDTFAPGDEFTMPAKNVDMAAQWQEDARKQVTITFNTMGGAAIDPISVGKGEDSAYILLPQAYKEGFVFAEWFVDEALTKPFYENVVTVDVPITLYACYYEVNKKEATYLSTGESSLTSQDANTVIMIDSFGVQLTQDNYTDYITVTNNYTVKETPNITLEQSGDMYLLKAAPAWPTGGNFYIEAKEPVKIIIETDDGEGNMAELAVSKLFFTIHVGDNHVEVQEKSHIIYIERDKYYAFIDDDLYLNTEFAFDSGIAKDRILKVFDENGNFEYVKVGGTATEDFNGISAFVVRTIAPSLNEVYNEFKLSYTEENINSADYMDTIDEQEVIDTLSQSEGLMQLQNMSLAMVADYASVQGFANVSGIELNDGTMITNEKAAAGRGYYNPIATIYKQEYGIDKEKGEIYGTWYIQLRGVDQQAKVYVGFGMATDIDISADGDFDIDVDVSWPWDDKFVDVSADIWFDVYVKHNQSISFTFDITYYNKGVEYDVRDYFENNDPYDLPDNFTQKYKDLINMGNRDIPIFSIDLFVFKIDILQLINVRIPVGIELSMSINGSFSVETTSYSTKYYGIKGDINKGFESYSGETYCSTRTTVYYNGTFGVMAGVNVAVDLSILNLSKLGSVGVEIGFGVYYDFYGYGYTTTWYQKKSADTRYEKDVTETGGTEEVGAAFSEFGLYFKIGIYAKSDIFKVKIDATAVFKIPLVQTGERYLLLDFSDEIKEYAKNGIVYGDEGFNFFDLGLHYYKYLDLREGEEVVRICGDVSDDESLDIYTLASYGDFNLMTAGGIVVDPYSGDIVVAERFLGERRASTNLYLYGYIGGYSYNDKSNQLSLTIPLHYVPDSWELDHDKIGETVHVTFMVGDKVYYEEDVEYGYTLMTWNDKTYPDQVSEIDIMYGSKGASDKFYAENPQYINIRWRQLDFNVVLKEDIVIKASGFSEKFVNITYKYIEGVTSVGSPVWSTQKVAVRYGTWLSDILPELSDPGGNILVDDSANWSVANKQADFSDEGTVITAQYEYKPVTLTVNVDAYETDRASVPAATYTYELTAGDLVFEYVNQHQSVFYKTYAGLKDYGVWWRAYVREGISTTTKIWQDTAYNIGWVEEVLTVTVFDRNNEILYQREVPAITDQSDIMEEEAVKNIAKTYQDENGVTWIFKGWINTSLLARVDHALVIVPIYEKDTHTVKLDPNGGRFDYATVDGDGCFYWEIVSGDTFTPIENYHRVLRDSTDTESYTFNGWYYLNEKGEKVFGFDPVLGDITYYADWVTDERTWDIVLYATGSAWEEKVLGTFAGENTDTLTYKKNYEDTNALIAAVKSGDYSMLPTPTANDDNYSFVKWNVVEFAGRGFELYPFYQNNGTALVIVDIGEGRMYRNVENDDYVTGQFTITFTDGETWGLANWNGWQPVAVNVETPYAYNEATGEFEMLSNICYEDEYYLYTFEGWQTSDGETSWTFETDQVVTVTAVYKQHYKRLTTKFIVDYYADDPERLDNGTDNVITYHEIYSKYGDVLDPALFPTAAKTVGNDPYDDSLWHYVFDHWECVETGESSVRLTVDGNREYIAVFKKEYRQVTVTFDAGENGIFPSTGERYFTITVNRGTNFGSVWSMVETPVRTDGTPYEFYEWGGYAETSDLTYDEISPAIWWNTDRLCFEGEEEMIQIILDTGDDNAVFENSGTRYYTVMFEQGTVLVDSLFWTDELADNEWPVGYLSNFVIIIDGEAYVGVYDIKLPFEMNMENDRKVLVVKELIPYDEYQAMFDEEYSKVS